MAALKSIVLGGVNYGEVRLATPTTVLICLNDDAPDYLKAVPVRHSSANKAIAALEAAHWAAQPQTEPQAIAEPEPRTPAPEAPAIDETPGEWPAVIATLGENGQIKSVRPAEPESQVKPARTRRRKPTA